MTRHVVARVDEMPPGTCKITTIAGRSIGVYNVDGAFFAVRNQCPHQGGPLCEGKVYGALRASVPGEYVYSRPGEMVRCPWHGWEFDVTTGQSWFDPQRTRVRSYQAGVVGAAAVREQEAPVGTARDGGPVKGPYVAETYPADADGEYVVVDI